ncbi:ribonuclease H-like domain-containing protein [Tanacetum coccineum]
MDSNPNDQWELSFDIDDSYLRLTPVLRLCSSTRLETSTTTQNPNVEKPDGGEECVTTQEFIKKVVEDMGEDEDFKRGDIKNFYKNGKLDQVVAIVKSCTPNVIGDLTVTLKDLSGAALILANVLIFSPKPSMHYLNITMRNVVKVFRTDTVPGSGSGVGGSGMLDEEEIMKLFEVEEIMKLFEEEEMADLELQVCGNVTDQEDQYKLDEKALNLALEEETRAVRAEHE